MLVASRKSLTHRNGVLDTTHEILERFEAHLKALGQFTVRNLIFYPSSDFRLLLSLLYAYVSLQVTANMRGKSAEDVAERILSQSSLSGLQVIFFILYYVPFSLTFLYDLDFF